MNFSTAILALFFCLFTAVGAAPIQARDVFVPPVTYPKTGTVWIVGQHHNVTWDVSNAPAEKDITNSIGRIYLRKGDITLLNVTLASGFQITNGRTEVKVPDGLVPDDDYSVVLLGDSGNFSPQFTILAATVDN